jgi:hypothetical protein
MPSVASATCSSFCLSLVRLLKQAEERFRNFRLVLHLHMEGGLRDPRGTMSFEDVDRRSIAHQLLIELLASVSWAISMRIAISELLLIFSDINSLFP